METTPATPVSSTTSPTTITTSKRIKCGILAAVGLPGAAFCATVSISSPLSALTGGGASPMRAIIVLAVFGAMFCFYSIYAVKGVRNANIAHSAIAAAIGGVVFVASVAYGLFILPH